MRQLQLLLFAGLAALISGQYSLDSSFYGVGFFDNFEFYTDPDPTLGFVQYVNRTFANHTGMIAISDTQAAWGVDNTEVFNSSAAFGRYSIRLTSIESWTHGLFVLNLAHMPPNQCGVWPAFWTLGTAQDGNWPDSGEIDIIEYANTGALNLMSLHTQANEACTIAGSGQTGTLLTNNCSIAAPNGGCSVSAADATMEGNITNTNNGGFYAMEWTSSSIKIWYWASGAAPSNIKSRDGSVPDPSTWGSPVANFQGDCDFEARFFNHSLVFDTTFCGTYAGNTFAADSCPMLDPSNGWTSCNEFVANNPQAYVDAYWQVNWLNVYTTPAAVTPSATVSTSSVVPAVSTGSVSTLPVPGMGQTTTPSLSLLVTSSPTATNTLVPFAKMHEKSQDGLDIRAPGEVPPECRILPSGPVPAPDPLPQCNPMLTATNSKSVRGAKAQVGGVQGGTSGYCSVPGIACENKTPSISEREPEPQVDGTPGGSVGLCSVPGMACNKHFEVDSAAKRDAQPQNGATGGSIGLCGVTGSACEHDSISDDDKIKLPRTEHTESIANVQMVLPSTLPPRQAKLSRTKHIETTADVLMLPSPTLPLLQEIDSAPKLPRTERTENPANHIMLPSPTLPPRQDIKQSAPASFVPSPTLPSGVSMHQRAVKGMSFVGASKKQAVETGPSVRTSSGYSVDAKTSTVVAAVVAVVSLLTLWSNGVL